VDRKKDTFYFIVVFPSVANSFIIVVIIIRK